MSERLTDEQLQEYAKEEWKPTHLHHLATELIANRATIAELTAENATFREWIDRNGDTITRMHAENAHLRERLKGAREVAKAIVRLWDKTITSESFCGHVAPVIDKLRDLAKEG